MSKPESDERDPDAIYVAPKTHRVEHLLACPGRAAYIVDEAVTVTEDELGARTLGDLVRRGRHFGLEVHVLTQRVTDWIVVGVGFLLRQSTEPVAAREAIVRVIDDGAKPGPKVLATAVVVRNGVVE